jgi:hypothetical protein
MDNVSLAQDLLKKIVPQYFQDEYLSLKDVKDKKASVNKMFVDAEDRTMKRLDSIKQV